MTRKAKETRLLELTYSLRELPSSQHRAGLAGLVLMMRWLERCSDGAQGTCELAKLDRTSASFRFDATGFAALYEALFAAKTIEQGEKAARKRKDKVIPPLRIEEREVIDSKTKEPRRTQDGTIITERRYVYPRVIPRGAFLQEWDPSPEGVWIKLWRDMVWSILRGVPATRRPFQKRADGETDDSATKDFRQLLDKADQAIDLPSTYYLGAQERTAENVPFRDKSRLRFLLNFWPYCCSIYAPRTIERDGKAKFLPHSYVFSIPDVAQLDVFCDELPEVFRAREHDQLGYLPKGAVIDIVEEGGLDAMHRLGEHLAQKSRRQGTSDLLLGTDVVLTRKERNNVRVLGAARVDPDPTVLSGYARLRSTYWNSGFRRQRILNLLHTRPWHFGFGRYLSTCPRAASVESRTFKHDSRQAFKGAEVEMHEENEPANLDELLYRVVGNYLSRKLESKHGLRWDDVKSDESAKWRYGQKREKLAKTAFLAVRAHTGTDFVEYFSTTLFSVSHYLTEAEYLTVSRALLEQPETVRTLTMLALNARA